MGQTVTKSEFDWSYTQEPHATRRRQILAKYPEVRQLMKYDLFIMWRIIIQVFIQILSAILVWYVEPRWTVLLGCAYCIGGTINHSLSLAIHETSHNNALGQHRPIANRCLGIFANLPIGVPLSISFRKYHLLHHRYQGDETLDVDLPCQLEAYLFKTTGLKLIWLLLQPLFYTLRPIFRLPLPVTLLEIANIIIQIIFDALVIYYLGIKPFFYLIAGSLMATGAHPMAGHFISEHYMFSKGYETYSYYGPLNWLAFNVGYHNEHHDFPNIPGSRLHQLKEMAPEFYENLPSHNSWIRVLYEFVTDPEVGLYSRVKRPSKEVNYSPMNNSIDDILVSAHKKIS